MQYSSPENFNPFKSAVSQIEGIILSLEENNQEYDIPQVRQVLEKLLAGEILPGDAVLQAKDIAKPPIIPDTDYSM